MKDENRERLIEAATPPANPELLAALDSHLSSDRVVVTGGARSGKSWAMACWLSKHLEQHPYSKVEPLPFGGLGIRYPGQG